MERRSSSLPSATGISTSTPWTPDGTNVRQLTHELGYDGGPFSRPTATSSSTAPHHPRPSRRSATTKTCSSKPHPPTYLEIWLMKATQRQAPITAWARPALRPRSIPMQAIIFSSNVGLGRDGPTSKLYAVDVDGRNLERITTRTASMDSRCLVRWKEVGVGVGRTASSARDEHLHRGLGSVERKGFCRKVRDKTASAQRVLAWPPARSHGALRAQKVFPSFLVRAWLPRCCC